MYSFTEVLIRLSFVPVLLIGAYTSFVYSKLPKTLKLFAHFIFFSTFIQLSSTLLWFMSTNNMPLLHIYVALGFVLLMRFYTQILSEYISRQFLVVITAAFLLFAIINITWFESWFRFNSNALTVESILLIILSLFTFNFLLDNIGKERLAGLSRSVNWINSGIFFYYSTSLLIFYFGDLFSNHFSVALNRLTWTLHALFSSVMYTCFFIGIWIRPHR